MEVRGRKKVNILNRETEREREREKDANKVITMQREIPTAISFSQAKKKKSTECEKVKKNFFQTLKCY